MILQKKNFFFQDVGKLKGVGPQLSKYLKNKKDSNGTLTDFCNSWESARDS